jgi:GNAT superfamily N-acetyltransferase
LRHADLVWKIRPPPEYPWWRRFLLRLACNAIRLEYLLLSKRGDQKQLPTVLCPRGGKALLECHMKATGDQREGNNRWRPRRKRRRIGKFGFTTEPGAPIPQIQAAVRDLYGRDPGVLVRTGAIIYMYVEPEYRGRDVGTMALQVMSLVQACQNIDFTVLVANDKGSGRLLRWYEDRGFNRAPDLQDAFGSPNARYGVAMMSPTRRVLPDDCTIQWW